MSASEDSDRYYREIDRKNRAYRTMLEDDVRGAGHDSLAARLAFAVADGIITDQQRTAILTQWHEWGTRTMGEDCYRSEDEARQIRARQGWPGSSDRNYYRNSA